MSVLYIRSFFLCIMVSIDLEHLVLNLCCFVSVHSLKAINCFLLYFLVDKHVDCHNDLVISILNVTLIKNIYILFYVILMFHFKMIINIVYK